MMADDAKTERAEAMGKGSLRQVCLSWPFNPACKPCSNDRLLCCLAACCRICRRLSQRHLKHIVRQATASKSKS